MAARAKILVITADYDAEQHDSGNTVAALLPLLAKQNFADFTWATAAQSPIKDYAGTTHLAMEGLLGKSSIASLSWPLDGGLEKIRRLKAAIASCDLLWLHDAWYPGAWFAFHSAKALGKPVFVSLHRTTPCGGKPWLNQARKLIDQKVIQPVLAQSTQASFSNDRDADAFYSKVSFKRPVKIIPNGVDHRIFHLPLAEKRHYLRRQFALRADQPVMLYVGRLARQKGIEIIHHMATQLPDWRFWFAGTGTLDPARWNLPNIHVFRDRSQESLAELYQAADLLLVPGMSDGLPLVIQEAMACGLPVMCSPETAAGCKAATPLFITDKVIGNDAEETAKIWVKKLTALRAYLPLDNLKIELADFAQAYWSWPTIAEAYGETLRNIIKNPA